MFLSVLIRASAKNLSIKPEGIRTDLNVPPNNPLLSIGLTLRSMLGLKNNLFEYNH